MDYDHIKESRRHLLELPKEKRIEAVLKDIWVDCPQMNKAIRMVRNIVHAPIMSPAPCMLIVGEGGSGKSSIVAQLKKDSKKWDANLAFFSVHESDTRLKFPQKLAESLGAPPSAKNTKGDILSLDVQEWIKVRQIRGIVIDEFHDSLIANRVEQQKNLALLKWLSGPPLHLSIIGLGTEAAFNALAHDTQLSRRYHIHELPKWVESEEFRSFLAAIEENLPLKFPSALYSPQIVKALLIASEGLMDKVIKSIKYGAVQAILSEEERITKDLIERANMNPFDY